jgi:capsular polysaccharide biosynthesis protein
MDLITQFNVFHNAKTIMGIHGAGLSGLVFADVKTPVIEIYPVDRNIRCFESLVSATGHTLMRIPFEKGARRIPQSLMSMINSL